MALEAAAVAAAIAALSVDGIKTIRDLNSVGMAYNGRDCPLVAPAPDKYLTLEDVTPLTLGENGLKQYTYTLTYHFIQAPVGQERTLGQTMPSTVSGYVAFIKAVAAARRSLGASHIIPVGTPEWGVLKDASGQDFQAADILLRVVNFSAD